MTTNWTAFEALSMLKSRAGWAIAADLWDLLTDPLSVDLVRVTEDIEQRALDLFFGYRDKTWRIVDCANLVVMEDLGCRQAFGFDRHFLEASRQRGFELLPADSSARSRKCLARHLRRQGPVDGARRSAEAGEARERVELAIVANG